MQAVLERSSNEDLLAIRDVAMDQPRLNSDDRKREQIEQAVRKLVSLLMRVLSLNQIQHGGGFTDRDHDRAMRQELVRRIDAQLEEREQRQVQEHATIATLADPADDSEEERAAHARVMQIRARWANDAADAASLANVYFVEELLNGEAQTWRQWLAVTESAFEIAEDYTAALKANPGMDLEEALQVMCVASEQYGFRFDAECRAELVRIYIEREQAAEEAEQRARAWDRP